MSDDIDPTRAEPASTGKEPESEATSSKERPEVIISTEGIFSHKFFQLAKSLQPTPETAEKFDSTEEAARLREITKTIPRLWPNQVEPNVLPIRTGGVSHAPPMGMFASLASIRWPLGVGPYKSFSSLEHMRAMSPQSAEGTQDTAAATTKQGAYVCPLCPQDSWIKKAFKKAYSLQQHLESAHGQPSSVGPQDSLTGEYNMPQPIVCAGGYPEVRPAAVAHEPEKEMSKLEVGLSPKKVGKHQFVIPEMDEWASKLDEAILSAKAPWILSLDDPRLSAMVDVTINEMQIMIISPTRTTATHIEHILSSNGLKVHACVGGNIMREERAALSGGPHVITCTPGRVLDVLKRGWLSPHGLRMLVLNQHESLLGKSFRESLGGIWKQFESISVTPLVVRASFELQVAPVE